MIQSVTAAAHASPRGSATGEAAAARSVGQAARTAVQVARDDGLDLRHNAQGMAARAIARGADPQSVFAGLAMPPVADGAGESGASGGTEEPVEAAAGSAAPGAGAADAGQAVAAPTGMPDADAAGADDGGGTIVADTALPGGPTSAEAIALAVLGERWAE